MHVLLGNSHMESGDYKSAIRSFEHAWTQMRPYASQALSVISLVSHLIGYTAMCRNRLLTDIRMGI